MDNSSFIFGRRMCEYESITRGVLTLEHVQWTENPSSQFSTTLVLTCRIFLLMNSLANY